MRFRKFKHNTSAGVTTYVMIIFGMVIMMNLFGFTTIYDAYIDHSNIQGVEVDEDGETVGETETSVVDPDFIGIGIFQVMTSSIYATLISGASIAGLFILIYWFRNNSAIWNYIIPIVLLIILNIFIFPVNDVGTELQPFDAVGISFSLMLIAFFNLFFVLAVVEFVRGSGTT